MKSELLLVLFWHAYLALGDYVGAVAEHTTYVGSSSETTSSIMSKNLDLYEGLIALAASQKVQVLVFPEFGLAPDTSSRETLFPYSEKIPESSENVTPCGNIDFNDRPMLSRMSCAAKSHNISILVNTVDLVSCSQSSDSNCPEDGHYQYNTDVVFNENGVLAAKYHKSHEWPGLKKAYDQPLTPSHVTYKSSFGVEFGLFICFDIMFDDPPKVLRSQGIEHFLYAVQQGQIGEKTIIESWSKNNAATVLSANLGSGKDDCSGLIVNGTPLDAKKFHLVDEAFKTENILVATVPSK